MCKKHEAVLPRFMRLLVTPMSDGSDRLGALFGPSSKLILVSTIIFAVVNVRDEIHLQKFGAAENNLILHPKSVSK